MPNLTQDDFSNKTKRKRKNAPCSWKSPFCARLRELHIPDEPEVSIRAADIVLSLRPGHFRRRRPQRLRRKSFCKFDENNIMIRRRDHICDLRERVNHRFSLYSQKAFSFFREANQLIFDQMSPLSQKHLASVLRRPLRTGKDRLTPRASDVRFSSFNRDDTSRMISIGEQAQGSDRVSQGELGKQSGAGLISKAASGFKGADKAPELKGPTTHSVKLEKEQFLDLREVQSRRLKRSRSQPFEHSRDLVFEREMMGIFFKKLYGENRVFVIQKSKTFNLVNSGKGKIVKSRSKFSISGDEHDFDDKSELEFQIESDPALSQKMIDTGKSVKSEDSCDDPAELPGIRPEQTDPLFEMRKQRNFSKRFYKCKVFTEKCQELHRQYLSMREEFDKKEIEKYKKWIRRMKQSNTPKVSKLDLFDLPFEKRMKFVNRMKRFD